MVIECVNQNGNEVNSYRSWNIPNQKQNKRVEVNKQTDYKFFSLNIMNLKVDNHFNLYSCDILYIITSRPRTYSLILSNILITVCSMYTFQVSTYIRSYYFVNYHILFIFYSLY